MQQQAKTPSLVLLEQIPWSERESEQSWELLKSEILSPDSVLVHHADNHYTLIAGYFEEPRNVKSLGRTGYQHRRDWLVVAEHCTDWDPIRMLTWKNMREQLEADEEYCILKFVSHRIPP